jgi:pilus assembly protein Flp/PilA
MRPHPNRRLSLREIVRKERGTTLIEYGFLLILIAVVVITAIVLVGQKTNNMYSNIGSSLPQPQ